MPVEPERLKSVPLLKSLSDQDLAHVASKMTRIHLAASETLFRAGEAGDAIYILAAGSLGIYAEDNPLSRRLVALTKPGETVGEMALITDEPRSATVIGIRDSTLFKLTRQNFERLVTLYPSILIGVSRLLAERLRASFDPQGPRIEPKVTALLPVTSSCAPLDMANRLADILRASGSSVFIATSDDRDQRTGWFAELESQYDHVLLCGDITSNDWLGRCARQADRILVLSRSEDVLFSRFQSALLAQRAEHQLVDLVVLHDSERRRPTGTYRCHKDLCFNRHFHIREHQPQDWQRLARLVSGKAVGLVLGGGGARAYAHIGVYKACLEKGIPIDFVGGTSMGAIIAACIAMGWNLDDIIRRIRATFVKSNPLSDYSLPLLGLVSGAKVERLLKEHFRDIQIADMWLPFYCVSSNLTTASVHIHMSGMVREALRASISLPGILPPVINDTGVLVDGGVMNNLPVDIMQQQNPGAVIAVDVARDLSLTPDALRREQEKPLWRRFLSPPIFSILMRSGTLASEAENQVQLSASDLSITPSLGDIDIRHWRRFDDVVEAGYQSAMATLEQFNVS
ncbi:patatin-like phospholipase family protein [Coralliovum pocilloporae]|uniref:patatin-like phospholipase family protein n=1 Tax=Coralliovum pocilloporae TaxID=3066369 RepID=UPI0033077C40